MRACALERRAIGALDAKDEVCAPIRRKVQLVSTHEERARAPLPRNTLPAFRADLFDTHFDDTNGVLIGRLWRPSSQAPVAPP
jgi:hypothetical protein